MTESSPPSVWDALPAYEKVQKWQRAVPDAAERILVQVEEDAKFIRRDAERRLTYALVIVVLTLVSGVLLALLDKTVPALVTSSGGTIAVATTLITGRVSAVAERQRRRSRR
ncbi:hypothetical protein KBX50_03415 [Micromonospora sp. C51]|uniref:hypothetical protein n=1 Tax=Micromonospora sp. C51 TaxID=2824879 RepID=UPI001B36122C|nr:hypothetical protein [Micromonospora sp. C51]MBQ1047537.1 hypothetical protein [Micromonospora sp. C51]